MSVTAMFVAGPNAGEIMTATHDTMVTFTPRGPRRFEPEERSALGPALYLDQILWHAQRIVLSPGRMYRVWVPSQWLGMLDDPDIIKQVQNVLGHDWSKTDQVLVVD